MCKNNGEIECIGFIDKIAKQYVNCGFTISMYNGDNAFSMITYNVFSMTTYNVGHANLNIVKAVTMLGP